MHLCVRMRPAPSHDHVMAAGYLMARLGLSFSDALQVVYTARPCIAINQGFMWQLRLFGALLAVAPSDPRLPQLVARVRACVCT